MEFQGKQIEEFPLPVSFYHGADSNLMQILAESCVKRQHLTEIPRTVLATVAEGSASAHFPDEGIIDDDQPLDGFTDFRAFHVSHEDSVYMRSILVLFHVPSTDFLGYVFMSNSGSQTWKPLGSVHLKWMCNMGAKLSSLVSLPFQGLICP